MGDHSQESRSHVQDAGACYAARYDQPLGQKKYTNSIKVAAEVCLHCGERLYAEDVVKLFEEIRGELRKHEFSHFRTLGQSFTVEESWPNKPIWWDRVYHTCPGGQSPISALRPVRIRFIDSCFRPVLPSPVFAP